MKPPAVAEIHRQICESAKCKYLKKLDFSDPCASCPNGHWGQYEVSGCEDAKPKFRKRKLGDRIASVAQPIARAIDKLSRGKTKVAGCGGCKQMQSDLNAGMPFRKALGKRLKRK